MLQLRLLILRIVMLDCLLGNLFLLFFHVLLQIQDQIRFRLKDPWMMLVMQPNVDFIDL